MADYEEQRKWLKAYWDKLAEVKTDQQLRKPYPELAQPVPENAVVMELPAVDERLAPDVGLYDVIAGRRSHRKFSTTGLSLAELAWLLWSTQGVRSVPDSRVATLRTVPSGGARHTFEAYMAVGNVDGLEPGLYRYLALKHQLCQLRTDANIMEQAKEACNGQRWVANSAVAFFWTTIPYRAEWRYAMVAHKMIAIDAGHVGQNLYLACGAIGCGTCAIGAYDQDKADALLGVDGTDEFTVYTAPVGKVPEE